ncbi:CHY zinc finger protein [Corynebacterium sp.]|uniref:CHY zinc finger protein n=1 Tax=Corynebacterium sp. TaxID=1720 RepID=UPI0026DA7D68|nr:CHY zinc finger protein [Corynebacterium sp.]MDO5032609.1 CHY zinc finger protein [Corynebacterium sp.]
MIHGSIDAEGRCRHWHSLVDVVANKCATCQEWFACAQCHAELRDHPFGRMPKAETCVMCGVCGQQMDYATYSAYECPGCGHPFNPGCSLHADIYFEDSPAS